MTGQRSRRSTDPQVDQALQQAIDCVRQDAEFLDHLQSLRNRDREILRLLAE